MVSMHLSIVFFEDYSDADRHDLQDELILLITRILIHHQELHYYQVRCQLTTDEED